MKYILIIWPHLHIIVGGTRHTAAHPAPVYQYNNYMRPRVQRTRPEISEQVGAGEDEAYHHEDNPLQLEREEGSKQETRL